MNDVDLQTEMTAWRHHLHANPETGFEEYDTAEFVATILSSLGLDVHRGIGGTGVIGILRAGGGNRAIGLRADMDALNIHETAEDREHVSQRAGKMHACGHDGHMAMLLGAAKTLANSKEFNRIVHFVFQPAEEHGRGARAMLDGAADTTCHRRRGDRVAVALSSPLGSKREAAFFGLMSALASLRT
jgi:hippurate hydrolase